MMSKPGNRGRQQGKTANYAVPSPLGILHTTLLRPLSCLNVKSINGRSFYISSIDSYSGQSAELNMYATFIQTFATFL